MSQIRCGAGCVSKTSYTVTVNGTSAENQSLQLVRNLTYVFDVIALGNPFAIHTLPGVTSTIARYSGGNISGQGVITGALSFTVPANAPNQLYYQSETNFAVFGRIDVIPFVSQPDNPPTVPPTAAPTNPLLWKPKCAPFLKVFLLLLFCLFRFFL